MSIRTQIRDSWIKQLSARLMVLSLLLGGVMGCSPAGAEPVNPTTPAPPAEATLPSGWETYSSQGQCGYAISHPVDMEGASQGTYSWMLRRTATEPSGPVPNFVYISVIPDDFQSSESEVIYNYDAAETEFLLNMKVGESGSVRESMNLIDTAPWFTHTRLPDTTLSSQTARTYENTQPWEFPSGTKEIRYYLKANGCTYLIGEYMDTTGSNQTGAINEELFDEIIATFRLNA